MSFTGLKDVREEVSKVLLKHPEAKANYNLLVLLFWAKHSRSEKARLAFTRLLYDLTDEDIRYLVSCETITRNHRELMKEDRFQPDPETVANRARREATIRREQGGL